MTKLMERNKIIPNEIFAYNQLGVLIQVFEDVRQLTTANNLLRKFELIDIPRRRISK